MVFVEPKTPQEYQQAFDGASKAIVYFTAQWCGPCRAIAPIFEKMANENPDIVFIKVDIDSLNILNECKGISSVPTFRAFHNKTRVKEFAGANPSALQQMANELKSI